MNSSNMARRRALVLFGCAALVSSGARALRPTKHLVDLLGPIDLNNNIPKSFGNWIAEPPNYSAIINPELQGQLEKLYSEIFTRSYVDRLSGYRIMLSLAYGGDQSDAFALHLPDVCYPAQGFRILDRKARDISLHGSALTTYRLSTQMLERVEPVTYWVVVGGRAVKPGVSQKMLQLEFALSGLIPDGLLFRVSSIDRDSEKANSEHDRFIKDIFNAVNDATRARLFSI